MKKQTWFIIGGVGAAILVAVLIWYFVSKKGTTEAGSKPAAKPPINPDSIKYQSIKLMDFDEDGQQTTPISWKDYTNKFYSPRFGAEAGNTAAQVVQIKIEKILSIPQWLEGVRDNAEWRGLSIETNLIWEAINSAQNDAAIQYNPNNTFNPPLLIDPTDTPPEAEPEEEEATRPGGGSIETD